MKIKGKRTIITLIVFMLVKVLENQGISLPPEFQSSLKDILLVAAGIFAKMGLSK